MMAEFSVQRFKEERLKYLTREIGVYALCDLDETPIYVGQTVSVGERGILGRVRRHLTSARSDVIANRQVDVWEVAFVWAWPLSGKKMIDELEAFLFHKFNEQSPLVNGTIPADPGRLTFAEPDMIRVQIMEDAEIKVRQDPTLRFPRQIQHFGALVDYILNTQDKPHLRRALQVYFDRLQRYHRVFVDG